MIDAVFNVIEKIDRNERKQELVCIYNNKL